MDSHLKAITQIKYYKYRGIQKLPLLVIVLLTCHSLILSRNSLPDNRKANWFRAGYLRFNANTIQIKKINNVLDFGATNNGIDCSNNNHTAIMQALSDTSIDNFSLIYFPKGIYVISSELSIVNRSRIIIRGDGSDKTKLIFNLNHQNNKNNIIIQSSSQIGIENLTIERADSADYGSNFSINAENCWISGVESKKAVASHALIYSSKHIEIRGCHFHHAWNYGVGGHGYGIDMSKKTSYCLVENSIFNHLRHAIIVSNAAHSNVFGYNFSTDPYTTEKYLGISDWPSDLCLHGHSINGLTGPYKNLFEGNICAFMQADNAWEENGPFNTYFRNRAIYYGLKIDKQSENQNIIANEVDDCKGSLADLLWNALSIQSGNNYIMGNTNHDPKPPEFPKPSQYSSDLSLYLNPDSLPNFLKTNDYWPPIGVVDNNHLGGGTIPAKKRWDIDTLLTQFQPQHLMNVSKNKIKSDPLPSEFSLAIHKTTSNHPLTITYQLYSKAKVCIAVYSSRGRCIRTIENTIQIPGIKSIKWNRRTDKGGLVGHGVYIFIFFINNQQKCHILSIL